MYLDRIIASLQQTKLDLVLLPGFDAGALRFLMHHFIAIIEVYCRAVVVEVHLNAAVEPVDICRFESKIESVIPAARTHVLVLEAIHRTKLHWRTLTIDYNTNGMPDYNADRMYASAKENGTEYGGMDTMPDIVGLGLWKQGHWGVYVGNGYAIEAMGTQYGVVRTKVEGRGWQGWCKIPYIQYDD